jgi:hypothetical protein
MKAIVLIAVLLSLTTCTAFAGQIIYVDADASGANDGTSWADAYPYLQDALADANDSATPVEIRVGQGTYKPDRGGAMTRGDREATFQLINGVTLKGGYAGFAQPDPDARDIGNYETILSGDLAGNDAEGRDLANEPTRSDNSHHIIRTSEFCSDTVLDGLTITGANANGSSYPDDSGGGMLCNSNTTLLNCTFTSNFAVTGGGMSCFKCSMTLTNCAFLHNSAQSGGGIYNQSSRLEPVPKGNGHSGDGVDVQDTNPEVAVTDCTFTQNSAENGGGMYNVGADPLLTNCAFKNNGGGGMYNRMANPTLTDCVFNGNVGFGMHNYHSSPMLTDCTFEDNCGGGMHNHIDSDPTLRNCTFTYNFGAQGGGMGNFKSNPALRHCTFRGNRAVGDTNVVADGGAMYNYVSSPLLSKCVFSGNSADQGGGISSWHGSPTLANCILTGNLAGQHGGGLYNNNAMSKLINCTFCNNRASTGASVYSNMSRNLAKSYSGVTYDHNGRRRDLMITSCILWDGNNGLFNTNGSETIITYSSVQGGWPGEGNIDVDPCFAKAGYWDPNGTPDDPNNDVWVDGDYHLKSQAGRWEPATQAWVRDDITSPCIDAGDPASPIGQEPFPNGGIINMGAYGGTAEASKSYFGEPVCETIVAGDINGDCKVDFLDFTLLARHWLQDGHITTDD